VLFVLVTSTIRRVAAETACRVRKIGQRAAALVGAFVKSNTEVEEAGCGPGGDPRNIFPRAQHRQDSGMGHGAWRA
jgi:hypothetical protein